MCKRAVICPLYDSGNKNGINNSCIHCEYIKAERKLAKMLRTLLGASYLLFVTSTYIVFW